MNFRNIFLVISCLGWMSIASAADLLEGFSDVLEKAMPSVVNVSAVTSVERPILLPFPLDELFYGRPRPTIRVTSLGSAVMIDADGIFLTSNHVVDSMSDVQIRFTDSPDERPVAGRVIGRDPDLDLALVKMEPNPRVRPIQWGDSEQLKVGEFVLALGNPFGQGLTASHGILSAKGRTLPGGPSAGFLQTDAPINPGNSGGPLLNRKGELIGINTAIQFNAQGISYAIPSSRILEVLPQLKDKGRVERGDWGLMVENLRPEIASYLKVPPETLGAIVTMVFDHRPAAMAGVKPYDLIVSVNQRSLTGATDLASVVQKSKIGETVDLGILRNGKERKISIIVGKKEPVDRIATQKQEKEVIIVHPPSGVRVENLPDAGGVLVTGVIPGSPAERSGLAVGDILLELDQVPLKNVSQYRKAATSGKKHILRLMRTRMGQDACTIFELDLS
jgi:serine protease Do